MKTPLKTSSRRSTSARRARSAPRARSKTALGRYLAAGLGATGLATVECEAGVVNIAVTSLGLTTGANAGVSSGGNVLVNNFLGLTGRQFNVSNYLVIPPPPGVVLSYFTSLQRDPGINWSHVCDVFLFWFCETTTVPRW